MEQQNMEHEHDCTACACMITVHWVAGALVHRRRSSRDPTHTSKRRRANWQQSMCCTARKCALHAAGGCMQHTSTVPRCA